MFKVIIGVLVVTVVGLFVLSKVDQSTQTVNNNVIEISSDDDEDEVNVAIDGQILHPGKYDISSQATLSDLIDLAGGLLEDHDPNAYTATLVIGSRTSFYIPKKSKTSELCYEEEIEKVNINEAEAEELDEKTELSATQAKNLVAYREENGAFEAIEDILNVKGIGDATFAKVKDYICLAWE